MNGAMVLIGAALSAGLLVMGCGSPNLELDHLEYSHVTSAADTAELRPNQIVLAHGTAVAADVEALRFNGKPLKKLELLSLNAGVIGVEPGPRKSFIFYGVGLGRAQIEVISEGRARGVVDALVVRQGEATPAQ